MNYWLIKTEPSTYGWDDLIKKGSDMWEGVRNYTARNNLKAMKKGDLALFYHSVKNPGVVGIAEIIKEHYPDPTAKDGDWVVVDVKPVKKLVNPVSLKQIKETEALKDMVLVKLGRLSVQPVKPEEFKLILEMAGDEI